VDANKAGLAMAKFLAATLIMIAGFGSAEAGFRSPESLVRNVYAMFHCACSSRSTTTDAVH
jgi:hypothetical protein